MQRSVCIISVQSDRLLLGWTPASGACLGLGGTDSSCGIKRPQIWNRVCGKYFCTVHSEIFFPIHSSVLPFKSFLVFTVKVLVTAGCTFVLFCHVFYYELDHYVTTCFLHICFKCMSKCTCQHSCFKTICRHN